MPVSQRQTEALLRELPNIEHPEKLIKILSLFLWDIGSNSLHAKLAKEESNLLLKYVCVLMDMGCKY